MISCTCMANNQQIVEMDNNDNIAMNDAIDYAKIDDVASSCDNSVKLDNILTEVEGDIVISSSDYFTSVDTVVTESFIKSDVLNIETDFDEIKVNANNDNLAIDDGDNCRSSIIDKIILQNIKENRKHNNSINNVINTQQKIMEGDKENNHFSISKKLTPNKIATYDNNQIYTPHTQIKMLYSPDASPEAITKHESSPLINDISLNMDELLREIFNKLRKDKETINIMQFISVYRRLCKAGEKGNLFKEMTLANNFSNNGTINEEQFVKGFSEYIFINNSNSNTLKLLVEVSNT